MPDPIKEEIAREIAANTILVYGKGTKSAPRCGFTQETIQFFDHFGFPFEVVDVLENMPKRDALAEMTDWPTLPKVFINGKFYGDTDILGPMADNGELQTVLKEAFPGVEPVSKQTINLHERTVLSTLISPEKLREHLDDPAFVAVDCRHALADFGLGARLYAESHVPGAFFASVEDDLAGAKTGTNGRHPMPDPETFARFLRDLGVDDETQIVAYDAGADMFAPRLWFLARWIGHEAVAVLDGGFTAWLARGYPVSTQAPAPRREGRLRARPHPEYLVDADYVLAHLGDASTQILDARAEDRFAGQNETVDPVAGHIPGARNRWFKRNFNEDATFKSAGQLRAEFHEQNSDSKRVVNQCGSGVSAAVNFLAMELAGIEGARIYGGSWSEWIADPSRPIATGPA